MMIPTTTYARNNGIKHHAFIDGQFT